MYQALYRKYRPRAFSDVCGQEHITKTLKNEILLGRVSHAYLFVGSRGTGKTTCAKIFANAVNCLENQNGDVCGNCEVCSGFKESIDVVELDAASNNGVNDIRDLCERAHFMPVKSRYKVYIIDEVHMLSAGAWAALLKTLEEPPQHVIFILATTEVHKIPATILSRCQRHEFHRLSEEVIASRLRFVANEEGCELSEDAAFFVAKAADGALRDGLSLLDKCILGRASLLLEDVQEILGMPSAQQLRSLAVAVLEGMPQTALSVLEDLSVGSKDTRVVCTELLEFFRQVMVDKACEKEPGFSEVSLPEIVEILEILQQASVCISKGAHARTALEVALVKACGLGAATFSQQKKTLQNDDVKKPGSVLNAPPKFEAEKLELKSVEHMAKEPFGAGNNKAAAENAKKEAKSEEFYFPKPAQPLKNEEQGAPLQEPAEKEPPKNAQGSGLYDGARPFAKWAQVLKDMEGQSIAVAVAFKGSRAFENGQFVFIDAKKEVAFELLRNPAHRDKIRASIKKLTGREYKLGPYLPQEKKSDPLFEMAQRAKLSGIEVVEIN